MKFRHFLFLSTLSAAVGLAAAAPAVEYLIIGNPAVCELYDQYEQPLSPAAKRALPRNMPFEIVNARQTMGDQITEGMRLSHLGTTWYLVLDDKGKTTGLPPAAAAVRYKGCAATDDTFVVATTSLRLSDRNPPGSAGTTIAKGETVIRVFTCGSASYYYRPGASALFGWSQASRNAFKAPDAAASHTVADEYALLHERIMKRLADANERYDSLFRFFNTKTQQQKAVPRWKYVAEGNFHRYTLAGSIETVGQLESSTEYIIRDIDYMLMGKPFAASYRNGVITIGPRAPQ